MSTAPFPFTLEDPLDEKRKRLQLPMTAPRPMLGLPSPMPEPNIATPPFIAPSLSQQSPRLSVPHAIDPTVPPQRPNLGPSLPDPNDPKYNPTVKHGLGDAVRAFGAGLVGGYPAMEQSWDAKKLNAQKRLAADTAFVKDQSTLSDQAAQAGERSAKSALDIAQAQKALNAPPEKAGSLTQQESDAVDEMVAGGMSRVDAIQKITDATDKSKPPVLGNEDKAISDHLAAKGLPDTPANRDLARKELKIEDRPPAQGQFIPTYDPKTAALTGAWNPATGKTVAPPPGGGTTAPGLTAGDKRTEAAKKELGSYQSVLDEAQQAHTLKQEADAGNAEADVALVMTFFKVMRGSQPGQSSNIRFTQQESNLIQGARSFWGTLEVKGNKIQSNGQPLSKVQRDQVLQVIDTFANAANRRVQEIQSGAGVTSGGAQGAQQPPPSGDPVADLINKHAKH